MCFRIVIVNKLLYLPVLWQNAPWVSWISSTDARHDKLLFTFNHYTEAQVWASSPNRMKTVGSFTKSN